MTNKEKHLKKLKKLLALARNNSSPQEAALAMNRAQELMVRHNLNINDAELTDITEKSTDKAPSHAEKMPEYMAMLANMISRVFGVKCYTTHGREFPWNPVRRVITYYGPNERPQVAAYAFEVLGKQLMKARRSFISTLRKNSKSSTKTARADTYCSAWVSGAYQVVTELTVTTSEKILMESYRSRKLSSGVSQVKVRVPAKLRGTHSAAEAGFIDGSNARLHHGVNNEANSVMQIGAVDECPSTMCCDENKR